MTVYEARAGAILAALAPLLITYWISSAMGEYGLDVFSVLLLEGLGFGVAVALLRPRAWNAVLSAMLYFTIMTIAIFWIGYRAGYYDLP